MDVLQNALFLVQKSCSRANLAFCNLLFGAIHSHEKKPKNFLLACLSGVSIFIRATTRHSQRNQENFDYIDQVAYAIESLFAHIILEKKLIFALYFYKQIRTLLCI